MSKANNGKTWLNFVNLSDDYERRARFLPAVLSILILLPAAFALGIRLMSFIQLLLAGVGLGAIVAVGLSHLTSAMGNRIQLKLWPDWPHDSPTNSWLNPQNDKRSQQQKNQWYKQIKDVTGLDISKIVKSGDGNEVKRVINDAIAAVRSHMWKDDTSYGELMRVRNVDYGYARNLLGLRSIWLVSALISSIACWVAWWQMNADILWPIISTTLIPILLLLAYVVLPQYVRHKADYYAESFFASLSMLAKKNE